jgi:serine/threonine-protein kinase
MRKLEKYEILDEIGHGGMATVFRARDSRLDRDVALKVMHPHLRAAREARARFSREARSVARLRHPNILEIYDSSDEDSEESYIATELLTGPTLKAFAESHDPIPAEIAACFTILIARALHCAHDAGIVHRDVKPENVLLHENRTIKLTDFGIAQMLDAQSFTATGQILGSPGHMAPEQVEGGECDARTDVFALGTVLYYLSVGRLPFTGKNPHQILKRVVDGDFLDPLRARPSIGTRLQHIINQALAKHPDDRYQRIEALEEDLIEFVAEVGIEEPESWLANYLEDPAATEKELRSRVIEKLTALGQRAAASRDVTTALDYYNRVLAIDDGNDRVLDLVDRLTRRRRHRLGLIVVGSVLAALGILTIAYAFTQAKSAEAERLAQGEVKNPPGGAPQAIESISRPEIEKEERAGEEGSSLRETPGGRGGLSTNDVADPRARRVVRNGGKRTVVFRPSPMNVTIRVDDEPARNYSPSGFHSVELSPGLHRFRLAPGEGAQGCCEPLDFSVRIPPGSGPHVLAKRLPFRPARLYVVSNHPADVLVGNGKARGRTRELIAVPMDAFATGMPITVTRPGFVPYTSSVRLRANQDATVSVELEEAAGGQP